jgi:hypothetical protein
MPLSTKAKHLLLFLFPLFLIFLLFPGSFYSTPIPGIDSSWMIALHLAVKQHLTFGKDFVFTYGPLGVLYHRYPICVNKYLLLLADLYFFYVLFVGFRALIKKRLNFGTAIFVFACVLVCEYMETENWFFILMLFFLFSFLEAPDKTANIVHAGILSLICFYIKVNSGVLDLCIFIGTIVYAMISGKFTLLRGASILLVYIAALLASARLLHTDLPGYILGSLQYMKDYEDVMYLPLAGRFGVIAGWGAGVLMALLLACYGLFLFKWFRNRQLSRQADALFVYLLVAGSLFVWYKNGFVRADGHVRQFFQMVAPLTLLLYVFTPASLGTKAIRVSCWVILVVNVLVIGIIPVNYIPNGFSRLANLSLIPTRIREIKHYFVQLGAYDGQVAHLKDETTLPNKFRDVIGGHTVDIIPTEISTIYFNGLNYDPRPTLQSYAAYNSYLDSLNRAKYLAPDAPEYVLFTLDGTLERFAWSDEARVKLSLLQRYRFVAGIGDQLLLKRREVPRRLTKLKEETLHVKLGEEIPVKETSGTQIQYTKFIIRYNWSGKAQSLIYQPPPLRIVYRIDDGDVQYHQAFLPVCADGMILNKFVDDTREFQLFLLSGGRLNADVRSVRIEPMTPGGFSPDVTMVNTWYSLEDGSPAEQREDSLNLLRLTDGNTMGQPLAQPPSDTAAASIRYGLQSYRDHGGLVRLQAWAIRQRDNDSANTVRAYARSDGGVYPFTSEPFKVREYPIDLRGRTDLNHAGVISILSKSRLPPGSYEVGLGLYDQKTGRSLVRYIDRFFNVDGDYPLHRIPALSAGSRDQDSVQCGIDLIRDDKDGFHIQGWAVLTSARTETPAALLLQNDTATYRVATNPRHRPDIMGFFHKAYLHHSGFSVTIPKMDAPAGIFWVGIEKTGSDGRTRSWKFTGLKIQLVTVRKPVRIKTPDLPPPGTFFCNIDQATGDSNVINVKGWALRDTVRNRGGIVDLVLMNDSATFVSPVDREARPDIAARYGKDLINCGFSAMIAKDLLPAGTYRLGLILHDPGKPGTITFLDKFIRKQ